MNIWHQVQNTSLQFVHPSAFAHTCNNDQSPLFSKMRRTIKFGPMDYKRVVFKVLKFCDDHFQCSCGYMLDLNHSAYVYISYYFISLSEYIFIFSDGRGYSYGYLIFKGILENRSVGLSMVMSLWWKSTTQICITCFILDECYVCRKKQLWAYYRMLGTYWSELTYWKDHLHWILILLLWDKSLFPPSSETY